MLKKPVLLTFHRALEAHGVVLDLVDLSVATLSYTLENRVIPAELVVLKNPETVCADFKRIIDEGPLPPPHSVEFEQDVRVRVVIVKPGAPGKLLSVHGGLFHQIDAFVDDARLLFGNTFRRVFQDIYLVVSYLCLLVVLEGLVVTHLLSFLLVLVIQAERLFFFVFFFRVVDVQVQLAGLGVLFVFVVKRVLFQNRN